MTRVIALIYFFNLSFALFSQPLCSDTVNVCNLINVKTNDFDDEIHLSTPTVLGFVELPLSYHIFVSTSKPSLEKILYLSTWDPNLSYGGRGVDILFANGKKINKDIKVDVEVYNGYNYIYKAFIKLNKSDIELFKKQEVVKFRLYIYEHELDEYQKCIFKRLFNCMIPKIK
jgi:hypothetical protein